VSLRPNAESRTLGEWAELYRRARKSAKTRGIEWDLSVDEMLQLGYEAKNRCQVSGIRFVYTPTGTGKRPWMPSLDRIDPRGPYTKANVRLVCAAVNLARNGWTDDVLLRMCLPVTVWAF